MGSSDDDPKAVLRSNTKKKATETTRKTVAPARTVVVRPVGRIMTSSSPRIDE
jgi:hypothetical protein